MVHPVRVPKRGGPRYESNGLIFVKENVSLDNSAAPRRVVSDRRVPDPNVCPNIVVENTTELTWSPDEASAGDVAR